MNDDRLARLESNQQFLVAVLLEMAVFGPDRVSVHANALRGLKAARDDLNERSCECANWEKLVRNYINACSVHFGTPHPEPDERIANAKAVDDTRAALFAHFYKLAAERPAPEREEQR